MSRKDQEFQQCTLMRDLSIRDDLPEDAINCVQIHWGMPNVKMAQNLADERGCQATNSAEMMGSTAQERPAFVTAAKASRTGSLARVGSAAAAVAMGSQTTASVGGAVATGRLQCGRHRQRSDRPASTAATANAMSTDIGASTGGNVGDVALVESDSTGTVLATDCEICSPPIIGKRPRRGPFGSLLAPVSLLR